MKNKLIFRYVFILDVLVTSQEQLIQYFNIVQPDLLFYYYYYGKNTKYESYPLKCISQYC